ncbi:MAG: hypothetical protein AAFO94_03360 [Bacteroidota bacterium]
MKTPDVDQLRIQLSLNAKNGIDFIVAATVVWAVITYIWTLPNGSYNNSVFTFIAGAFLLPLAFALSKVFKTKWTTADNPLQPLGLWFNFAQLFYFPFLFFFLSKDPDHFIMAYAIITGAHFFPYAWLYKEPFYAVAAGVIAWSIFFVAMKVADTQIWYVPALMTGCLALLAFGLHLSYRKKHKLHQPNLATTPSPTM